MPRPIVFILGAIAGAAVALTVMFAAGIFGKIQSFTASATQVLTASGESVRLYPGMPADSVCAAVGAPSHVVHTWALWKSCDVWMYTGHPAISIIMVDGRLYSAYQQQITGGDGADCADTDPTVMADTVEVAWGLPLQQ